MSLLNVFKDRFIIFDGAMGTQLQLKNLVTADFNGFFGCNEILNLTRPDIISDIHRAYLLAGADIIETNTLGANDITLAENNIYDQTELINQEAAKLAKFQAKAFSTPLKPRYVAGSIGPGTKLISFGKITFDEMVQSYLKQIKGLRQGGADLLIIETCQDLLQIKCALIAAYENFNINGKIPLIVSIVLDENGKMLTGSSVDAVITTLQPFNPDMLGINCVSDISKTETYIKQLAEQFTGEIIFQPNAGFPEVIDGKYSYNLPKELFSEQLCEIALQVGVKAVGGCCGTTPEFIKILSEKLAGKRLLARETKPIYAISSQYSSQMIKQEPAPFFIGERTNVNGSLKFKNFFLENNFEQMLHIAIEQEKKSAHGFDLCLAYPGRNELDDISKILPLINLKISIPLFIDSTDPKTIEAALKFYGGRPVINSVNLEDGEQKANILFGLAKKYGAAIICLTIDESGMATDYEKKLEVAERLYKLAIMNHNLKPQDLIFDLLTFSLATGEEKLKVSAINTIKAIKLLKLKFPGVHSLLGVSNVSFGLAEPGRQILNSVFLSEVVKAGLDLAIVNTGKIIPEFVIPEQQKELALNLLYNKNNNALKEFISFFSNFKEADKKIRVDDNSLSSEEQLKNAVIEYNSKGIDRFIKELLINSSAEAIINNILIPSMKEVGELFVKGRILLPFVLEAAEVMKKSVDLLKPHMDKKSKSYKGVIIIATVRGDVHDIGKNLVDILFSNNGYKVINLGIKCELEQILNSALQNNATAIGLSGLLVKSTLIMKEYVDEMNHRKINIPVLLGGAALTNEFVKNDIQKFSKAPVFYCKDAFAGLSALSSLENINCQ